MATPLFIDHFDPTELFKLTTFTADYHVMLRLHPNTLLHRKVYVHWILAERRSVACVGPGCELCESCGREPRAYVPGVEWHNKRQLWLQRVVPINASCLTVLEKDLRNITWLAKRTYKAKNAPVRFEVHKENVSLPVVPDFDITQTLLRMWGCQTRVE